MEVTLEEWKPVPEWEGLYEVSSSGGVRSVDREFVNARSRTEHRKGVTLTPRIRSNYASVTLSRGSRTRSVSVHRLVCAAFHGPAPEGKPLALHRNGDHLDNRAENLYWGDQSENRYDSVVHGTHHNAAKAHCPSGHPYDAANTRVTRAGHRVCRACHRNRERIRGLQV